MNLSFDNLSQGSRLISAPCEGGGGGGGGTSLYLTQTGQGNKINVGVIER